MRNEIARRLTSAVLAAGCVLVGVLFASPALATTTVNLYVTPTGAAGSYPAVCVQSAPCGLGTALGEATYEPALNGDAVVINIAPGTYALGTGFEIDPKGASLASLELLGEGSGPSATVLSGNNKTRTLAVNAVTYAVTIKNLELEDGTAGSGYGGNLLVAAAAGAYPTTLDDAIVTGGFSQPGGQADVTSGGLIITNSTVENSGGDTYGSDAQGADLSVYDSTYSGNTNDGIYVGSAGNVGVYGSTIVGNGDYGVENTSGFSPTVLNSTVAGNGDGGVKTSSGSVYVGDSILDGNDGHDCVGGTAVVDDYSNVVDDSSCGFLAVDGSTVVTSSQIGLLPLANNGGPTETERITASSAAYDFVPLDNNDETTDQRGIDYLQPGQTMTDAGAYQVAPPTISAVSPTSGAPGASIQLTGNNLLYATAAFGSGNVPAVVTGPTLTSLGLTVPTLASGPQLITVTNADGSATIPFTVPSASSGATTTPTGPATVISAKLLAPIIRLGSTGLKFKRAKAPLRLTCASAACSGAVEVTGSEQVKLKHGRHRTETIVLARGSYRLAAGATGTATLTLTGVGKQQQRLAHAARHVLHATIAVTVLGGKSVTSRISLS